MRASRIIGAMVVVLLVFPFVAQAITVGPTRILNRLEPGESARGSIRVYNEGEFPVEVVVELADWKLGEKGVEFREAGSLARSSSHWLHLSPVKFELNSKEYREVAYNITFPGDVRGGYYAAILVTATPRIALPPAAEGASSVVITYRSRLGVLVYNEVVGTKKEVELLDFSVSEPEADKLTVMYEMENVGEGFVRAEGKFHIIDAEGRLHGSGILGTVRMHPGDSTQGGGEWVGRLPEGEYDLIMTLRLGPFEEKVIVREKKIKVGTD